MFYALYINILLNNDNISCSKSNDCVPLAEYFIQSSSLALMFLHWMCSGS